MSARRHTYRRLRRDDEPEGGELQREELELRKQREAEMKRGQRRGPGGWTYPRVDVRDVPRVRRES